MIIYTRFVLLFQAVSEAQIHTFSTDSITGNQPKLSHIHLVFWTCLQCLLVIRFYTYCLLEKGCHTHLLHQSSAAHVFRQKYSVFCACGLLMKCKREIRNLRIKESTKLSYFLLSCLNHKTQENPMGVYQLCRMMSAWSIHGFSRISMIMSDYAYPS